MKFFIAGATTMACTVLIRKLAAIDQHIPYMVGYVAYFVGLINTLIIALLAQYE